MIAYKHYGRYLIVLAAAGLLSCQKAPNGAQGQGASASETQASQQSETEIPASTVLWIQLQKDLDSSKLKTGDHFAGEMVEDVILNGRPIVPKGSGVKGRVTNSETAHEKGGAGLLSLVLESVTLRGASYDITTSPVTLQAAPLTEDVPKNDSGKAVSASQNAYAPKHGILQFFLSTPVRVKKA